MDGEFIPDAPDVLLESDQVEQKDVLMGVVKDEGATQTGKNNKDTECVPRRLVHSSFSFIHRT